MSSVHLGKHVWALLVNEGNWTRRLDFYIAGFSHSGPISRRVWAKAHGTHTHDKCIALRSYTLNRIDQES